MILIIDFGSSKTPIISKVLSELGFGNKIYKANEFNTPIPSTATGIILSGSPVLLTETNNKPYLDKYDFLKEINIPVLGICFGHQLLGVLHGTSVFLGKAVRTSIEINVLKDDAILKDIGKKCMMTEDHTEGIDLPKDFILLAYSEEYPNEAMKHKTKNIWGVQFHPEVSGEAGKILLDNFCRKCLIIKV